MYRPSQHKIQGLLVHASANQQVQGLWSCIFSRFIINRNFALYSAVRLKPKKIPFTLIRFFIYSWHCIFSSFHDKQPKIRLALGDIDELIIVGPKVNPSIMN